MKSVLQSIWGTVGLGVALTIVLTFVIKAIAG